MTLPGHDVRISGQNGHSFAANQASVTKQSGHPDDALEKRRGILEIVEGRYSIYAAVIVSRFFVKDWYPAIGDPTVADAIRETSQQPTKQTGGIVQGHGPGPRRSSPPSRTVCSGRVATFVSAGRLISPESAVYMAWSYACPKLTRNAPGLLHP